MKEGAPYPFASDQEYDKKQDAFENHYRRFMSLHGISDAQNLT
ncbi:hypothetical protein ACPOL_3155 [Acidisarcina polymorpha]|uniref:Uncharacterized protein n=1 Tax=Acidisarcina polymorpha TaxID=2211140 RepID=A0A2Z5G0C4_9BACT|nr:hypothetical protein ACPOL_3155 [Acidisarcina polymorpha]